MKTPVLFTIFNRPDLTRRVFARIRDARPPVLLVVADGPRDGNLADLALCRAARAEIRVDWPCELVTNYAETNMGCGVRLATGTTWAFTQVERALTLEDDNLPHMDYFAVVDELLDRFADYKQIWGISGSRAVTERMRPGAASYTFEHSVWHHSFATWRDRWAHFDFYVRSWKESDLPRRRLARRLQGAELQHWIAAMDEAYVRSHEPRYHTFDYQVQYLVQQFGWCAVTAHNMVQEIGFRADATNNRDAGHWLGKLPAYGMEFPLVHPAIPEPLEEIA